MLPDGKVAAVLNSLCDAIGLARHGQLERIQRDEILRDQLLLVQINSAGGPQIMNTLTAWAIPTWLQGVRLGKVAADRRDAILAFKREAADVLYRHFSQRPSLPPPDALVPSEPVIEPAPPARDATPAEWREWRQAMRVWLDWQDQMDAWCEESDRQHQALMQRQDTLERRQDALEDRIEGVEALSQIVAEMAGRFGPPTLTTEHQATVRAMVARLHELGGFSYGAIYGELNASFHVAKYSDIPDDQWGRVAEWFQARIASAERRRGREP